MSKILLVVYQELQEYSGISKKIISQYSSLKKMNPSTELCQIYFDSKGYGYCRFENNKDIKLGKGILFEIALRSKLHFILEKYITENNIKSIYIRYELNANPFFVNTLKKLYKKNVKIFLEIPTYPYDGELRQKNILKKIYYLIEKGYRTKMAKYIFRIITFSEDKIIWNVPTIQISNGIDFNQIKLKKSNKFDINKNKINLISVSMISFWHGLDRIINGIANFNSSNLEYKAYLNIVGGGDQIIINQLKNIVKTNNIEEYIIFWGPMYGIELDNLFDHSDFAIGSLGRHRCNIQDIKPLKNREYAARGIPFGYSENDKDFDNSKFIIKFEATDNPLDIELILDFLLENTYTPEKIRSYIYPQLSWEIQMNKVIKFID